MKHSILDVLASVLPEDSHPYFESGIFLEAPVFHARRRVLDLHMEVDQTLPFSVYENTLSHLKLAFHAPVELKIKSRSQTDDLENVQNYLARLHQSENGISSFAGMHPSLNDGMLVYSTSRQEKLDEMKLEKEHLERRIQELGINLKLQLNFNDEIPDVESVHIDLPSVHVPAPEKKEKSFNSFRKSKNYTRMKISELEEGMQYISIQGHIFDMEDRELKTGTMLQMIYVSDYEDAIICKRFSRRNWSPEKLEEEFSSVKKGMEVVISGSLQYDGFSKMNVLMIDSIEKASAPVRSDLSNTKRTELHVHTNFSEMDGVCAVEEYIQTAWDWGMNAIGITDHNVVQAFPMAQHKVEALKKSDPDRDFKVCYGCEMTMVEDGYNPVYNNNHARIKDAVYAVFDTETTGLSARLDRVIEFGAVKMKEGEVLEKKQFFINPHRQIPTSISSLTHISQADVETALDMSEHFDEIAEFFKDTIIVAHNAAFDMAMMNEEARRLGKEPFANPVIDTLHLAYGMLDLKSYKLGSLCRNYGVAYDGEGAHRADYDARVLSEVFLHMLNEFDSEATLDDLIKLEPEGYLRRNHGKHIAVYAKNADGLKELFELISLSHTKYLAYNPNGSANSTTGFPRIPRSELARYHEKGNLLFGSACQNGEIFDTAHTKGEQALIDAMSFYDYIEIQPLSVYKNLIDRHSIQTKEDLQQILRFIIEAAEKAGKPVLATGDCHYVNPCQKRIRDIYINSKAIGSSRHPLYKYSLEDRKMQSNPDQHFLTSDEMLKAFEWLGDDQAWKIVVENPRKIAGMMDELFPVKDKLYPPDIEGSDQKLRDICYETAKKWYGEPLPKPVSDRLERELDAIIGAGYYVVYYISHLLVKKSNDDGYLVGSRGSVGSSFVATMSGITEVNPLKPHYICKKCHYLEWNEDPNIHSGFDLPDKICPNCGEVIRGDGQDIPFETFLGFEGDKVPDIDLNFSGDYQPNAHAFTKTIFGDDHVFRAGTVGTVQEKTAYGYVLGYEEELELPPFSEAKRVDLAKGCEGVKRTTGQHPGGIVVVPADMDIHDFSPVQYPANNPYAEWKTTHFDFHQIHDNILKFDILGHVDPTAMKMMERLSGIDCTTIPMNDPETMAIFSTTQTLGLDTTRYDQVTGAAGIPEYGTPFVRGILELTKPTTFAELVSISGLSHGTNVWLNNAKDLIDAGICNLREVIGCRDDIMVDLLKYGLPPKASFTIMESVRKGKGLKPEWEELMKENNVPEWYMDSCRKIKYMFPKAHAVAYVMMAVRSAWFKVHMPRVYYCQYFSIRCDAYDIHTMIQGKEAIQKRMFAIEQAKADKTQKVSDKELAIYDTLELAYEMAMRGFHFSNLSISRSDATEFIPDPDDEHAIIPPFTAVDSLGANVGKSIVEARSKQAFLSKEDIMKRTQLSKTLLEKLDRMNALEGLDEENQMTLF